MASNSKSTNLGGANVYIQRCELTAYFNETGTSTTNNTSTVYCKASLYSPSVAWDNVGRDDHLYIYWHDNRENYDRHVATWSGSAVGVGQTITAEGTITVTHKDDGTLSGYAYAVWSRDGGNTNYAPASGSVATDWTNLTTIARASKPTIGQAGTTNQPDFNIGDTITIYTNRKSSSFTHTVKFNYGDTSVTVGTGVGESITFDTSTIASDLYALIPNANTYSGTVSVTTYKGSTNIGTKTCAYNANVANSNPTWAHFDDWVAYTTNTHVRTALANSNVNFLQGMSIIEFQGNKRNAPVALNGASLANITVSIADAIGTLTWDASLPTNIAFDIGNPTQAGMMTLNAVVTDSRGNASTFQRDVYVIPYQVPGIAASCERQSNFENDTTIKISGTMASVKFGIGDTTTERNSVDPANGVAYRYRESTSQTWSNWIDVASTTTASGTVTTTPFILSLDNQKEWEFEFSIIDFFNSETTITRHVGQGQPQFFIGADGRTSIGGVPQIAMPSGNLGQLEVNGNAYANGKRLAELPITNADLDAECVTPSKVNFKSFMQNGSYGKLIPTTIWLGADASLQSDTQVHITTNAGNTLTIGLCNNGSGAIIFEGGSKIILAEYDSAAHMTRSQSSEFGIQGVSGSQTTWLRFVGQLAGSNKNEQRSFGVDGQTDYPGRYFGTAIPDVGGKYSYALAYKCILRTPNHSTEQWDLQGMLGCAGVNTSVKFEIECTSGSSNTVPSLYQRGTANFDYWWHKITVWELVETNF